MFQSCVWGQAPVWCCRAIAPARKCTVSCPFLSTALASARYVQFQLSVARTCTRGSSLREKTSHTFMVAEFTAHGGSWARSCVRWGWTLQRGNLAAESSTRICVNGASAISGERMAEARRRDRRSPPQRPPCVVTAIESPEQALVKSQSGPLSSVPITARPAHRLSRIDAEAFLVFPPRRFRMSSLCPSLQVWPSSRRPWSPRSSVWHCGSAVPTSARKVVWESNFLRTTLPLLVKFVAAEMWWRTFHGGTRQQGETLGGRGADAKIQFIFPPRRAIHAVDFEAPKVRAACQMRFGDGEVSGADKSIWFLTALAPRRVANQQVQAERERDDSAQEEAYGEHCSHEVVILARIPKSGHHALQGGKK